MSARLRSTRGWVVRGVMLLVMLVLAFPLSLAAQMIGLDAMGVAARSLRGPVWWGGAEELTIAGIRLGTVNVFVNPLRLVTGTVRVSIARVAGRPDDATGGLSIGAGSWGIEAVTGSFALGTMFEPLPLSRATVERFTARFAGGRCILAEGRVRVQVAALVPGLDLANGLSGEARCAGERLLLPLASQSGQERLELRIGADGGYEATMRIKVADPALAGALGAHGFRPVGDEQLLRLTGRL